MPPRAVHHQSAEHCGWNDAEIGGIESAVLAKKALAAGKGAPPAMSRPLRDAERQIRELEARLAHQQALAFALTRHGFKGAAAEVLSLVSALRERLGRDRRSAHDLLHAAAIARTKGFM